MIINKSVNLSIDQPVMFWSWWLSGLRCLFKAVVWCDPWPGLVLELWGRFPLGGMAGLHTLVNPLIHCIINQLYSCQN